MNEKGEVWERAIHNKVKDIETASFSKGSSSRTLFMQTLIRCQCDIRYRIWRWDLKSDIQTCTHLNWRKVKRAALPKQFLDDISPEFYDSVKYRCSS